MVLEDPEFTPEEKDRARWIRVWQAPEGTTEDQFEAIVVALNFEPDHKEDWPEYVKARLVVERYRTLREDIRGGFDGEAAARPPKAASRSSSRSSSAEVKRYLEMVQWADDFEEYHTTERGLDPAAVRYKANDIFQWFYEVQAGKGQDKIVAKIEQDDDLRAMVYDLMYDVLDSGIQVRSLHKVVADEAALDLLKQAHEESRRRSGPGAQVRRRGDRGGAEEQPDEATGLRAVPAYRGGPARQDATRPVEVGGHRPAGRTGPGVPQCHRRGRGGASRP